MGMIGDFSRSPEKLWGRLRSFPEIMAPLSLPLSFSTGISFMLAKLIRRKNGRTANRTAQKGIFCPRGEMNDTSQTSSKNPLSPSLPLRLFAYLLVAAAAPTSKSNRGNDGSVNIIINFGWAGSPGQLISFPTELKGPNRGTFCQRPGVVGLRRLLGLITLFLFK